MKKNKISIAENKDFIEFMMDKNKARMPLIDEIVFKGRKTSRLRSEVSLGPESANKLSQAVTIMQKSIIFHPSRE